MQLIHKLKSFLKSAFPDHLMLHRGPSKSNCIALTFDDGPYPANTEKIIAILKKYDIKATFFVNGVSIEKNKQAFEQTVFDGHEIGNHLYRHNPVTSITYQCLDSEIKNCQQLINGDGSYRKFSRLFRPPHGEIDFKTIWYTLINNWTIVLWSLDSRDLETGSFEENIEFLESRGLQGGEIILLHDDSTHAEELLVWIIEKAQAEDKKFVTISELINNDRKKIQNVINEERG